MYRFRFTERTALRVILLRRFRGDLVCRKRVDEVWTIRRECFLKVVEFLVSESSRFLGGCVL